MVKEKQLRTTAIAEIVDVTCPVCKMRFTYKPFFADHLATLPCFWINKVMLATRYMRYMGQMAVKLGAARIKSSLNSKLCTLCKKISPTEKGMRLHMQVEHGYITMFFCMVCDDMANIGVAKTESCSADHVLKHMGVAHPTLYTM